MGIINPMPRAVLHTYFTNKKNTHLCFGAQPKKTQYFICYVARSKIQTWHHLGATTTYQ
jgi:hypothetical protein